MNFSKTYLPLFKGIDLSQRRLPMMVARTDQSGPVIWLTAAIHGDEVTGIAVIQSVFKRLEQSPLLKGSLYAFPILNPIGFEMISRAEPFDEEDLNRSFSSLTEDSPAAIQAQLIGSTIIDTHPDFVIDLHTDSNNSIPYIILDDFQIPHIAPVQEKSIELAKELGFPYACDTKISAGYNLEQSLSGYLVHQGIPALTVELGGPLVVNEDLRKLGLEAVWQLLHKRNMVAQPPNPYPKTYQKELYYFGSRIKAHSMGIIDYRVAPGQKIKKGKILGKIRNVFGEIIETIRSPFTCTLFSHDDQSVVFPAQSLFTIVRHQEKTDS